MIAKRVVKFNIKKNHIDYNYIKQQLIESKEIYNYANYVIRQIFFKKSRNNKYNMDFVDEYPELKDLFLNYIDENKQFTTLFCKIIRKFAKPKKGISKYLFFFIDKKQLISNIIIYEIT